MRPRSTVGCKNIRLEKFTRHKLKGFIRYFSVLNETISKIITILWTWINKYSKLKGRHLLATHHIFAYCRQHQPHQKPPQHVVRYSVDRQSQTKHKLSSHFEKINTCFHSSELVIYPSLLCWSLSQGSKLNKQEGQTMISI